MTTTATEPRTLRGLLRYFLALGGLGFGGPIALVGYMQRDLVEERGWFSEDEFRQALAVGQTMPGPLRRRWPCGSGTCRQVPGVRSRSACRLWSRRWWS